LIDYTIIKDLAGPIATVIAASAAAFVAYRLGQSQISVAKSQAAIAERNWQTTNEKIVLELFERRLPIYEEIREIIGAVVRNGDASIGDLHSYGKATDRVPYLFGPEVQAYVEQMRLLLIDLQLANKMMRNMLDPDRPSWIKKRHEHFAAVTKFYTDAPGIFGPYMRAHQKVPSTG
jgi:hypothetical protein